MCNVPNHSVCCLLISNVNGGVWPWSWPRPRPRPRPFLQGQDQGQDLNSQGQGQGQDLDSQGQGQGQDLDSRGQGQGQDLKKMYSSALEVKTLASRTTRLPIAYATYTLPSPNLLLPANIIFHTFLLRAPALEAALSPYNAL